MLKKTVNLHLVPNPKNIKIKTTTLDFLMLHVSPKPKNKKIETITIDFLILIECKEILIPSCMNCKVNNISYLEVGFTFDFYSIQTNISYYSLYNLMSQNNIPLIY